VSDQRLELFVEGGIAKKNYIFVDLNYEGPFLSAYHFSLDFGWKQGILGLWSSVVV
jgi:hypothetical protein